MKKLTPFFLLFFLLLFTLFKGFSQAANSSDCLHPNIINFSEKQNLIVSEEIYYQEDDVYTFWYKLTSPETINVTYKLESIAAEDVYELFIYNYNEANFCNALADKKTIPTKLKLNGNLILKKNQTYYISVLHLAGKGCGHELLLNNKNRTVSFKAIQNTCFEEVAEEIISQEIKNDSIERVENMVVEIPIHIPDTEKTALENLFKGKVINNETKQPIDAEITIISLEKNTKSMLFSSKNEGFELAITNNNPLIVHIEKLGYKTYIDTISDFTKPIIIALNPLRVGEKIVMHKIYFHPNTPVLKVTSKTELEKLANFVKENKSYKIEIQGHTNGNRKIKKDKKYSHLGDEWNFSGSAKELSQLRAEKIKAFLAENGGNESNIIAKGYGGDKMIINNPKNMKEAMKNIRVEIVVVE